MFQEIMLTGLPFMADFSLCGGRHFFFSYCAEGLTTRKATWGHCAYPHFTDEETEARRGGGGAGTPGLLSAAVGCGSRLAGGRSDRCIQQKAALLLTDVGNQPAEPPDGVDRTRHARQGF